MLTYKNDPFLLDRETANDLIGSGRIDLLFLGKDKGILNLYAALVKREDFSRDNSKRIFSLQKVPYIVGQKILNKVTYLITNLPKDYRINNNRKIRGIFKNYIGRKSKIGVKDYKNWFKNKRFPLPFLRVLSRIKSETDAIKDGHILGDLLKEGIFTNSRQKGSLFYPKVILTDLLVEKQAYLAGCILGDGCLAKSHYMSIVDGTSNEEDLEYSAQFLVNIKKLIESLYCNLNIRIIKEKNKHILSLSNKWFCRYINFFFGIPVGYKKDKLSEPKILSLGKDEDYLERLFWRGLFDTDGHQYKNSRNAGLSSHSHTIIKKCEDFLKKHNIHVTKSNLTRGHSVYILSHDFLKFATVIGFAHPKKQKLLMYWLKKEHKSNILFDCINEQNMHSGFFDLSLLPLRVYKIQDLIKKYRGDLSYKKLSEILDAPKSTVFGWISGTFGMPIQKLIKIAELQGYTKLEVFNELNNTNGKTRFCLIEGKGRGNEVKLPLKITPILLFIAKNTRTSFPKLHIRNKINRKITQRGNIIASIENLFEAKTRLQKNGIYRVDSATLAKFFETFFMYDYAWKPLSNSKVNKLKENWNTVWC